MDKIKLRVAANAMRRLRELGLSEREWCARTGYPYGALRSILSARARGISSSTILALADALGVSFEELLT